MNQSLRQCPRCGTRTRQDMHCGIRLKPKRFKLTPGRIQHLKILGLRQKGLTDEHYNDLLRATTGRASTKDIRRGREYYAFLQALKSLPDVPERRAA